MMRIREEHMGRRVEALLMSDRVYIGGAGFNHRPDEFRILDMDSVHFRYTVDGARLIHRLERRQWRITKIY